MTDIVDLDKLGSSDWEDIAALARGNAGLDDCEPIPSDTLEAAVATELMTPDPQAHIQHAVEQGWIDSVDTGGYVLTGKDSRGITHLLGEPKTDAERVRECLESAVDYYHQQLDRTAHYWWIEEQWGLPERVIDQLDIGWVPEGNDVIHHLREEGYTDADIARGGIATSNALKHVYRCNDADCTHTDAPNDLTRLRDARLCDDVEASDINPDAVVRRAVEEDWHELYNWWTNRVVFPYPDENGDIRYVIARDTPRTNDVDYAKYLKLQVREHTAESVYEPIYGVHEFEEDEPLVLTEGMTDAIAAHVNGINCLSPVTKAFKQEHWPKLVEYAEQVPRVYLVFDSEKSDVGLEGALRTADHLAEEGIDVRIGELPREDEEKVDLCEYLRGENDAEILEREVLDEAVEPEEHSKYEEVFGEENEGEADGRGADFDAPESNDRSTALYDLSIRHVVEQDSNYGVKREYRGDNPIQHVGDSHSKYFVYEGYDGGMRARDFKAGHTYTPMTWLACAADVEDYPYANRSTSSPGGSLSDGEKFACWMYAKDEEMIPDDDPVPYSVISFLADKYGLMVYPDGHDRAGKLPAATYNAVLNLVRDEYGYDPGRAAVGRETDKVKGEAQATKETVDDEKEEVLAMMMDEML